MLTVVPDPNAGDGRSSSGGSLIDEIVRESARRMLAEALRAEADAYVARFAEERDENGRRLVVRNGSHQSREVLTSADVVEVTAPRVNEKRVDAATASVSRGTARIRPRRSRLRCCPAAPLHRPPGSRGGLG